MAEYYGKLKDMDYGCKSGKFKKIVGICMGIVVSIFFAAVLVGIFGDDKRRDETREIVMENSELKQQVFELMMENESLKQENESLKNTLSGNLENVGTTISKPVDVMERIEEETEDWNIPKENEESQEEQDIQNDESAIEEKQEKTEEQQVQDR